MSDLIRFGISLPEDLLRNFDKKVIAPNYDSRSEAIRDLIRNRLVETEWESDEQEVAGTITLVYDHHVRGLGETLTCLQHECHSIILSTLHVHLDHDNCLEVLVIKGPASKARHMADRLISLRGIKHGKLTIGSTGREIT